MTLSQDFIREFTKKLISLSAKKSQQAEASLMNRREIQNTPLNFEEKNTNRKIKIVEIDSPHLQIPPVQKPIMQKSPSIMLPKIDSFIQDPNISDVECAGPEKQLTIKQKNEVKNTDVILTEEEIQQTIKEFSRIANTPIMNNILRAKYQSLELTAVISEFVGSRFILHKSY